MVTAACSHSFINGDDTTAVPGKTAQDHGVPLLQTMTGIGSGATAQEERVITSY